MFILNVMLGYVSGKDNVYPDCDAGFCSSMGCVYHEFKQELKMTWEEAMEVVQDRDGWRQKIKKIT